MGNGSEERLEDLLLVSSPVFLGLRRVGGDEVGIGGLENVVGSVVRVGNGLQEGVGGCCGGAAVIVQSVVEDEGEAGFGG